MLVLARKKRQDVILRVPPSATETVITVGVTDIQGDKARLGKAVA